MPTGEIENRSRDKKTDKNADMKKLKKTIDQHHRRKMAITALKNKGMKGTQVIE